jgi:thymidylate synthase (FAD)
MPNYVKPTVKLIASTEINEENLETYLSEIGASGWETDAGSGAEKLIEVAGKRCYKSFNVDLNPNLSKVRNGDSKKYIENILKSGHLSVIEHATVTFSVENVSRIVTHEKVRHRLDNYSQESMRFVRPTNINFVMGESYSKHLSKERVKKIKELHDETLTYLENVQKQLELICDIDNPVMPFSHKKEFQSDNRRLLPEGIATGIIFTSNHRALRHQIFLRTSEHAEAEIRYAFNKIAVILKEKYPAIYQDMTPSKQCKIFGETCYEYTFEFDKV